MKRTPMIPSLHLHSKIQSLWYSCSGCLYHWWSTRVLLNCIVWLPFVLIPLKDEAQFIWKGTHMRKEFHKWIGNWSLSLWISVERGKPGSEPFLHFLHLNKIHVFCLWSCPASNSNMSFVMFASEGRWVFTYWLSLQRAKQLCNICLQTISRYLCRVWNIWNFKPEYGDKKLTLNLTQEPQVIKLLRILSYQGDFDRAQWSFHNDVNTVTLTVIQISYRVEGWVVGHMDHLSSGKVCKVWICAIAVLQFWQLK